MSEPVHPILLVTPVWNDSSRLEIYGSTLAAAFAEAMLPIDWIIADDGSGTAESERLMALRDRFASVYPNVRLHLATAHHGKGSTVRAAWDLNPDAGWLAFVDADGSLNAADLISLIRRALEADQSVIGIRKRTAVTEVIESPWRSIFHHGFLIAARLILGLRCDDPQCGAKIIKAADYRPISQQLREHGFAFDSELLATLQRKHAGWIEMPVTWVEKTGAKIRPLIDSWSMLAALIRVRIRLG